MLMGNVYCSHQSRDMHSIDSGTLVLKSKKLEETAEHISRLSIRYTLNGEQHYKLGSHEHVITNKSYVVINKGQNYKTSFTNLDEDQEMILVAFKPKFAEGLMHSLVTDDGTLLDDPFKPVDQPVTFFERTFTVDPVIRDLFLKLRKLMDEDIGFKKEVDLDSVYTQMLTRLLVVHKNLSSEINKIKTTKLSTRTELYRRLWVARDYMDAHTDRRISIDEVAGVAFLSSHHFKRIFKELYGITPHRYHVQKRLDYSRKLLQNDDEVKVEDVCRNAGFENASSFIRLFREHYGFTPKAYHLNNGIL
jgi:AraC family transcriptional regulator